MLLLSRRVPCSLRQYRPCSLAMMGAIHTKVEAGLYPAIVLIVIAIDASRAAPSGTAVGCESTITIPVTFPVASLATGDSGGPNATCRFGESDSSAAWLSADGTEVQCPTPTFGRSGEISLHLDFISAGERVGSFAVFTGAPASTELPHGHNRVTSEVQANMTLVCGYILSHPRLQANPPSRSMTSARSRSREAARTAALTT